MENKLKAEHANIALDKIEKIIEFEGAFVKREEGNTQIPIININ